MTILEKHLGGHKTVHIQTEVVLEYAKNVLGLQDYVRHSCILNGQVYEAESVGLILKGIDGDHTLVRDKPDLFMLHDFTKNKYDMKEQVDMVWCAVSL